MSRPRRHFTPGTSQHVYNRGNNRMRIFHDDVDYEIFLAMIRRSSERKGVDVHALALMTTHFHLLVTPRAEHALPQAMKQIAERYARYYNRKYQRTGTLWEGRYKTVLMEDGRQTLVCLRYIEQNPLKAGLVNRPDAYRWSSCAVHARGTHSEWLVRHSTYLALGRDDKDRQTAYRALCAEAIPLDEIVRLRHR